MPSSVRRQRSQSRFSCVWADLVQCPLHCVCTLEQLRNPWRVAVSHIGQLLQTTSQQSNKNECTYEHLSRNIWPNISQAVHISMLIFHDRSHRAMDEQWKVSLVDYVQTNHHECTIHSRCGHSNVCIIDSQKLDGSHLLQLVICLDYLLCVMKDWIISLTENNQSIRRHFPCPFVYSRQRTCRLNTLCLMELSPATYLQLNK